MRGYRYAAGVFVYIFLVRYKLVTRIWQEGSEWWILKNTKRQRYGAKVSN